MTYRADCPVSLPNDNGRFKSRKDLGGYGWHPDHGLFIPVLAEADNIEPAFLSPSTDNDLGNSNG